MIVHWAGVTKPNTRCDTPIIGIDFYPTLLEIAGVTAPRGHTLDGKSITPLLKGKKSLQQRPVFWHFPAYLQSNYGFPGRWRTTPAGAVRQGKWKLIEFFEDGRLELYNLQSDISEKNNLAEKLKDKTEQMHGLLKNWRKNINAPVPTELNPKYEPEKND